MKEQYAERILKDESLFRSLFKIVWDGREAEQPETYHPDYEKAKAAVERLTNGTSENTESDLWSVIECFAETYYLTGLRAGASMIHTLLSTMDIQPESFGGSGASTVEILRLQSLMTRLVELDPSKNDLVERIVEKTANYTNITKKACRSLIETILLMIDNYETALSEIGEVMDRDELGKENK